MKTGETAIADYSALTQIFPGEETAMQDAHECLNRIELQWRRDGFAFLPPKVFRKILDRLPANVRGSMNGEVRQKAHCADCDQDTLKFDQQFMLDLKLRKSGQTTIGLLEDFFAAEPRPERCCQRCGKAGHSSFSLTVAGGWFSQSVVRRMVRQNSPVVGKASSSRRQESFQHFSPSTAIFLEEKHHEKCGQGGHLSPLSAPKFF